MPPKPKITRDMIVDAAFHIARSEGAEHVNARRLAEELGCSTQPVLYHFSTVEEVRQAAYEEADRFHSAYIMDVPESAPEPMLEIGLRYIRFASEEKNLFRFLFQSDRFAEKNLSDLIGTTELLPVLEVMGQTAEMGPETAREVFLSVFLMVHGYASMLANNGMVYDEEAVGRRLERAFMGAVAAAEEEKI